MPSFGTEVSHTLGRDEAVSRLARFIDAVRNKFEDQVSQLDSGWEENTLRFSMTTYGMKISGTLVVEETLARLRGEIPFAALPFRGKIEQSIASELERALS